MDFPGADLDHPNDRGSEHRPPDVGDEAAVGRERQVSDAMRGTGVEDADVALVHVEHAEVVTVVGKRDERPVGRRDHVGDAPDIAGRYEFDGRRRVRSPYGDLFVAVYVGYRDETLAVAKPLR